MLRPLVTIVVSTLTFAVWLESSAAAEKVAAKQRARTSSQAVSTNKAAKAKAKTTEVCEPCAAQAKLRKTSLKNSKKPAKKVRCHPEGYVDPAVSKNYKNAMRDMKRAGITPKVTSTWRSSEEQAQLHSCTNSRRCRIAHPGLYKALPPGRSLHEAGMAVDIAGIASGPRGDKQLTPRGLKMVRIMQKNGFRWRYGLADPAHFEADPTKYGYRSAAQAIKRSQSTCQVKLLAKAKATRKTDAAQRQPRTSAKTAPRRVAAGLKTTARPARVKATA